MKCNPDNEDAVAAIINQHPGVSHNYRRNHLFNLWYTIAVAPTSRLGLAKTVETLHRESGAEVTRLLPTLKLYKIGVQFDLTGESASDDQVSPSYTASRRDGTTTQLTPQEIEFIRALQRDLPLTPEPFLAWADELGVPLSTLQATKDRFAQQGKLRRFAAVLNHRNAGFGANAMGVWAVRGKTDAEVDRIGESMAGFRAVSHCYKRPVYPDWPFNIFTMVHGKTPGECEQVLEAISARTGVREYSALYSTKEYKKARVRYFSNEEQQWESQRSPQ
jgi:DNA-binding Lrp family transcriptional regulator